MRFLAVVIALLVIATAANADIIYVDIDATGSDTGTSWLHAFVDLQDALGIAVAGDEIWVADGVYKPTQGSDRYAYFTVQRGVHLAGGFAGVESFLTGRDWTTNVTILSGELGDTIPDDNSLCIVALGPGTEHTAVSGLSIIGAYSREERNAFEKKLSSLD